MNISIYARNPHTETIFIRLHCEMYLFVYIFVVEFMFKLQAEIGVHNII